MCFDEPKFSNRKLWIDDYKLNKILNLYGFGNLPVSVLGFSIQKAGCQPEAQNTLIPCNILHKARHLRQKL